VIDGIRIAPHVYAHRQKRRIEGRPQDGYLDCNECVQHLSAAERQLWNCGHLPRLPDNRGEYPLPEAAPRPEDDTCPGYLISLPIVLEAQELHLWWSKSQLWELVRGQSRAPWFRQAVEAVAGANHDVELQRDVERAAELRWK